MEILKLRRQKLIDAVCGLAMVIPAPSSRKAGPIILIVHWKLKAKKNLGARSPN